MTTSIRPPPLPAIAPPVAEVDDNADDEDDEDEDDEDDDDDNVDEDDDTPATVAETDTPLSAARFTKNPATEVIFPACGGFTPPLDLAPTGAGLPLVEVLPLPLPLLLWACGLRGADILRDRAISTWMS